MNRVILSPGYFPQPDIGRPISEGQIFVGIVDLDPEIEANQKQVSLLQESGNLIEVSQPVSTNKGGTPEYNGSPVTIFVEGSYSLKVLNKEGGQEYYIPNTNTGDDPVAVVYDETVNYPIGVDVNGSDGVRYTSGKVNGPQTTVVDPVGDSTGTWVKANGVNSYMSDTSCTISVPTLATRAHVRLNGAGGGTSSAGGDSTLTATNISLTADGGDQDGGADPTLGHGNGSVVGSLVLQSSVIRGSGAQAAPPGISDRLAGSGGLVLALLDVSATPSLAFVAGAQGSSAGYQNGNLGNIEIVFY